MEDIKRVQLSEIAGLITKGTTPTTLGYEFQEDGVNFLKIECFDENGGFIESKVAHISEECNEKLKRSQLKAGDVLFSIAGAIGRVAIVTEEMLPANTNQALAIIRIADEQVYLPYIRLILTSPIVIEQFEKKKQGVAQLNLSLKDINEISIPLPSKEKQIELAELFDKVAGVIAKRKTEISALDDLIKARFVELFGDPNDTKRVSDNRHKIGELCDVTKLAGFEFTEYITYQDSGEIIMLRGLNCKQGKLILDNVKYIDRETSHKLPRSRLYVGDILMTYAGTIGDVAMVDEDDKYHLAPNVAKISIVDKEKVNPTFLVHLFMYSHDYIMTFASQVAQASINMQKIRDFEYIIPSMEQQLEFELFAKQVDKSKFANMLITFETLKDCC